MRLTIVGCSGSFPGPESPASCYLLTAESEGRSWNVVLDLGSGALGALQRHVDLTELDGIFLSHLHPDHCADLCGLYVSRHYRPRGAPVDRLPVWGPARTAERVEMMYDGLERRGMQPVFDFRSASDVDDLQLGPFRVTSFRVNHPVEGYGYRVSADGATVAFTGDTDSCEALRPLMADADLVLADSAFVDGRDDTSGIHLSGSRAGLAATEAGGVGHLMLTHIPPWNDPEVCLAQARTTWSGELSHAAAGATVDVVSRRSPRP